MKLIDLHLHTSASDGEHTLKELAILASKKGLKTIAITDHDTVLGLEKYEECAKEENIEIIPGIEISCDDKELNVYEIHIVGLFIDVDNLDLKRIINYQNNRRFYQKQKIIEKLNDLGYEISFEELKQEATEVLGRPHIAKILIRKYPEKFSNVEQVFKDLLGIGRPAYIPQERCTIKDAISTIKKAKGIPILAHPGVYLNNAEKILEKFVSLGGEGVEVYYPYDKVYIFNEEQTKKTIDKFKNLAREKNLLISGGSDFHGDSRESEIGDQGISELELEDLKEHIKSKHPD